MAPTIHRSNSRRTRLPGWKIEHLHQRQSRPEMWTWRVAWHPSSLPTTIRESRSRHRQGSMEGFLSSQRVCSITSASMEKRVSWQPILGITRGVRIAAVVERVGGAHPGFVLAGRSLREVEVREAHVRQMAGLTWIGMIALIVIGTLAY